MELLDILNLAVLVLEQYPIGIYSKDDGGIDDRFIKNWGRAVYEKGAFKKLRVLVLRHFAVSLADTLKGLAVFPVLFLCNLDSWCLKQDLQEFTEHNKQFNSRRWRHMLTDG